jgi:hypothetical protein
MMQKVAVSRREFLLRMSGFKSGGWDAENILKKNNKHPGGCIGISSRMYGVNMR